MANFTAGFNLNPVATPQNCPQLLSLQGYFGNTSIGPARVTFRKRGRPAAEGFPMRELLSPAAVMQSLENAGDTGIGVFLNRLPTLNLVMWVGKLSALCDDCN